MIQRSLSLLLALLVGLPWAALPVAAGSTCAPSGAMGAAKTSGACSFCVAGSRDAAGSERLLAGCCRFGAATEVGRDQAITSGSTSKPHHSPDAPVSAVLGVDAIASLRAVGAARAPAQALPAHAPPTRTTHLLL